MYGVYHLFFILRNKGIVYMHGGWSSAKVVSHRVKRNFWSVRRASLSVYTGKSGHYLMKNSDHRSHGEGRVRTTARAARSTVARRRPSADHRCTQKLECGPPAARRKPSADHRCTQNLECAPPDN